MRYLPREDAPFSSETWDRIQDAVIGAARSQLAGRRLLPVVGPFGLGARTLEQGERPVEAKAEYAGATATMTAPAAVPVPLLQVEFSLPLRDLAAAEERTGLLELGPAARAGIACARLEDQLLFEGQRKLGIEGLLTAKGAASIALGDWGEVGQPLEDLIKAANALDAAGFPGPYAAALAPPLYNALVRRYQQGNMTQLEHARQLISAGLVKAPALSAGGVVLAAREEFASIYLGQDMALGFIGPAGAEFEFVVLESLCPRIVVPEAVCVLSPGK